MNNQLDIRRKSVFQKTNGVCYLCHEKLEYDTFTIDHVIPLSKGGKRILGNEMPAHENCNLAKGDVIIRDENHFIKLKNHFMGKHRWNLTLASVMNIVEDKLKEKRTNKTYNKTMKTHKVIAALNNNDENNEVFIGTYQECWDWKYDKPTLSFLKK
jgi:hypothetical protein